MSLLEREKKRSDNSIIFAKFLTYNLISSRSCWKATIIHSILWNSYNLPTSIKESKIRRTPNIGSQKNMTFPSHTLSWASTHTPIKLFPGEIHFKTLCKNFSLKRWRNSDNSLKLKKYLITPYWRNCLDPNIVSLLQKKLSLTALLMRR